MMRWLRRRWSWLDAYLSRREWDRCMRDHGASAAWGDCSERNYGLDLVRIWFRTCPMCLRMQYRAVKVVRKTVSSLPDTSGMVWESDTESVVEIRAD